MSCSHSSDMSNSNGSRWKLTEYTMIQVRINIVQHTQCSNMISMTQRQETLTRAKTDHRIHLALEKLKMRFSCRPPHWRTVVTDWENNCIVATKQNRGVHKEMYASPTQKNTTSLRDTRDNTTHMVFEGELAVKLHAKNVDIPPSANGNPIQYQVAMRRVYNLGSTNH